MIIFYEYPKCSTCQRAKKELATLVEHFEAIDIKTNPPKAEQLKKWMTDSGFSIKNFFNTSGNSYRQLGLKDKIDQLTIDQAAELLSKDGMLIKRPLLIRDENLLQIGARKAYQDLFKDK
ncbi:arsenate reductase family protein [Streptococcus didelphis]|uniref:Arsenate reductase family protein n=1 Tax=Streptococcus didelphis TaxID=102886 RepID=A0ABY9LI12_9STRE|nr:arsenate reductase family protein [Streptococcus didelphis]WMB28537.1 arsenate reductase family protein [Streptococcus didelphis]WMB29210.1 arsenate reductase family protein [Streptococcus didelphis]